MFLRTKSTPNSPRKSVQIVETYRNDDNRVRQRIVRHVGVAANDAELARLLQLGEFVKAGIEDERQPQMFPPDTLAELAINARRDPGAPLPVDLGQLREAQRVITGIHEVYEPVYRLLGFDRLLPRSRLRASHDILRHVVMARIANPDSKRGSVRRLEEDFGVSQPLEKVYRMMDHLDDAVVDRLRTRAGEATRSLLPEPLTILYFDCTTLYFESFVEDELRQYGFSKDGKHGQSQVLLALIVTREGLPVSYEVLPGATHEGHSLAPALQDMMKRHGIGRAICVADRGMLSRDNMAAMETLGLGFIVGARLRGLPRAVQKRIHTAAWQPPGKNKPRGAAVQAAEFRHRGRRLIVTWSARRARKDAHDRAKAIDKAMKKLKRSDNPRALLSNHGARRFVAIEGEAKLVIDSDKVAADARWDGLQGVITSEDNLPVPEVLARYHELWQVEASFRVTKHDLRVRPIFHWKPRRVKAHLAIAFMAYSCVRHLAYRVALQKRRLSPEAIRGALIHRQCSILRDTSTRRRYAVPSRQTPDMKIIYQAMGIALSTTPYEVK